MENVLTNGRQTMRKIQTSPFDTLCLRQVKENRQTTTKRRKKQRRRQTRIQFGCLLLVCPLLFFFFFLLLWCCCCFFYLTKTLSVESSRLYFSHRLSSIDEYIFHVLFLTHPHCRVWIASQTTERKKEVHTLVDLTVKPRL